MDCAEEFSRAAYLALKSMETSFALVGIVEVTVFPPGQRIQMAVGV
jgi:hypothetical protein